MTTTTPLVTFTDIAVCDGPCQGEAELWTDGIVGYATTGSLDLDGLARDGATITGACPNPRRCGPEETCPGVYTWDLTTEGGWQATTETDAEMLGYAEPMDLP